MCMLSFYTLVTLQHNPSRHKTGRDVSQHAPLVLIVLTSSDALDQLTKHCDAVQ